MSPSKALTDNGSLAKETFALDALLLQLTGKRATVWYAIYVAISIGLVHFKS